MLNDRILVILGSLFMFLGVGAGAFGAHALDDYFQTHVELLGTYDTAVRYQMIHSLGLFVAAWVFSRWQKPWASWAGILFLAGILLFSGSLYLLVFTRIALFGAITPLGGVAFLGGWLCLALAVWRSNRFDNRNS